jgi:hypothetical protein
MFHLTTLSEVEGHTKLSWDNLKERDNCDDLDVDAA